MNYDFHEAADKPEPEIASCADGEHDFEARYEEATMKFPFTRAANDWTAEECREPDR